MKKTMILLLGLIVSGCSALPPDWTAQFYTPTSPPPMKAVTATITPSVTPTRPTPTFTFTPTLIGQRIDPSNVAATPTIDLSAAPLQVMPALTLETPTAAGSPPSAEQPGGFSSVFISVRTIHHGDCDLPKETVITATVQKPKDVTSALAFFRIVNKQTLGYTEWTPAMAMESKGGGTYLITLNGTDLPHYKEFSDVWIAYQFVAVNARGNPVGRTSIVTDSMTLMECPE